MHQTEFSHVYTKHKSTQEKLSREIHTGWEILFLMFYLSQKETTFC